MDQGRNLFSSNRFWGLIAVWSSLGMSLFIIAGMILLGLMSVFTLGFLRGEEDVFGNAASSFLAIFVPCGLITGVLGIAGIMSITLYKKFSPILSFGSAVVLWVVSFIYGEPAVYVLIAPILLYMIAGGVGLMNWANDE